MILLLALVVAVGWAFLSGVRVSQLSHLPVRSWGLVIAAFGIQVAIIYLPLPTAALELLRVPLLVLSYGLLAAFVWFNRSLPGIWLLGSGLLANWVVILANGGHMPVTYENLVAAGKVHLVTSPESGTLVFGSKDVLLSLAETRLWFLSDIFVIPPPFPLTGVFSVGDALIAFGLLRFVPAALRAPARLAHPHRAHSLRQCFIIALLFRSKSRNQPKMTQSGYRG